MPPVRSKKQAAALEVTPPKKTHTIAVSQGQKQALIDNLQLEVTARARKLRAQYALQAQGLRTRIEIRVNRIPISLRKAVMQDLINKYDAEAREKEMATIKAAAMASKAASKPPAKTKKTAQSHATNTKRGIKRTSDERDSSIDQENTPQPDLAIPKKRTKTTTATTSTNPSQHLAAAQILSPKSSNARTLPGSPYRAALTSPSKSKLAGTFTSPSKPTASGAANRNAGRTLNGLVEKAKTTRAKAVRKVTPGSKAKAPGTTTTTAAKARRDIQTTITETTVKKKTVATKKTDAAPAAERRVLRKRA